MFPHPSMASKKISNYNYRQLKLKVDADNKLLFTLIMEAWEAVESDLNVDSPFYKKMAPRIAFARDALHECMPEMQWLVTKDLLFSSAYCGQASEADVFNTYMTDRYYALAYSYSFVRLLKDSKQTASIVQAIERLDSVFEEALNDIKKHIDFSMFEVIDVNALAKLQLGSGLIVLNSLLEGRYDAKSEVDFSPIADGCPE